MQSECVCVCSGTASCARDTRYTAGCQVHTHTVYRIARHRLVVSARDVRVILRRHSSRILQSAYARIVRRAPYATHRHVHAIVSYSNVIYHTTYTSNFHSHAANTRIYRTPGAIISPNPDMCGVFRLFALAQPPTSAYDYDPLMRACRSLGAINALRSPEPRGAKSRYELYTQTIVSVCT